MSGRPSGVAISVTHHEDLANRNGLRGHPFTMWTPMKKHPPDIQDAPPDPRPTRKKRRKSNEPEMLLRNVEIRGVSTTVDLHAVHHKGAEPYVESQPWLELRGTATEPVNGVTDVKISVWLRDTPKVGTARPASVGAMLGAKPQLSFGLSWLPDAFDRVWVLALTGHLKFARMYFTKPHYKSGLAVNASFSSELEE